MGHLLRQTLAILKKDLTRELRSREVLTTTIAFGVLLVVVFAFAFYRDEESVALVFPGILWVSIVFTGTLAIERSFVQEKEAGCLRALALIPGTTVSLYAGKLLLNLVLLLVFLLAWLPMVALTFTVSLPTGGALPGALILGLGMLGFALMGTLVAAMLVHHRLREVMLPLLLYPLLIPLLICGVKATSLLVGGGSMEEVWSWILFMASFDLVLGLLAPAMFGWVLGAIE